MTLVIPGQTGERENRRITEATSPVLNTLRSIEARLKRDMTPPFGDHGDIEPALMPEEAARLRCEGRNAAFQGMPLRSCPYATSSREKRDAWLEGFNTVK